MLAARLQKWSVIFVSIWLHNTIQANTIHRNVDDLSRLLLVNREAKELTLSMQDKLKICQLMSYNLKQLPDKIQFWLKCYYYFISNKVGWQPYQII